MEARRWSRRWRAVLGGITDYALAQILGMAAQRSITDLRKRIQQHVQRLPVRYFDSTKTGVLVSRVMNDAEGIRNLVGTGLLQMFGGLVTAGDRASASSSTSARKLAAIHPRRVLLLRRRAGLGVQHRAAAVQEARRGQRARSPGG